MALHGIPQQPFLAIAVELKKETQAETVVLADGDAFTYTVVGDEEDAMRHLTTLFRLMNTLGDNDAIYMFKGNSKTVLIRDVVNDDEIFFIVINAKESTKKITEAMRKALKAAKEEYIKRWKK